MQPFLDGVSDGCRVGARQNFSHLFWLFYSPLDFEYFRDTVVLTKSFGRCLTNVFTNQIFPFHGTLLHPTHQLGFSPCGSQFHVFCLQGSHYRGSPRDIRQPYCLFSKCNTLSSSWAIISDTTGISPFQTIVLTLSWLWRCL